MREHDNEPVWGLPEQPPEGEQILWQGKPDWRVLARQAMHVPLLAVYFAVMLGAHAVTAMLEGTAPGLAVNDSARNPMSGRGVEVVCAWRPWS